MVAKRKSPCVTMHRYLRVGSEQLDKHKTQGENLICTIENTRMKVYFSLDARIMKC